MVGNPQAIRITNRAACILPSRQPQPAPIVRNFASIAATDTGIGPRLGLRRMGLFPRSRLKFAAVEARTIHSSRSGGVGPVLVGWDHGVLQGHLGIPQHFL